MPAPPSQTVGPFLAIGLPWEQGPVADPDGVRISGRVLDGAGEPIADALVETGQEGPPAFAVHVFARGLLRPLTPRICFDASAIPDGVPDDRRDTLLPEETADGYR